MDASRTLSDSLLVAASRELKGKARRVFVAKVYFDTGIFNANLRMTDGHHVRI